MWDAGKKKITSLRIMLRANSINVCQLTNGAASSFNETLSISPPASVRDDGSDFQWSGCVPDRLAPTLFIYFIYFFFFFCSTRPRCGHRCASSPDSGENVLACVLNKTWGRAWFVLSCMRTHARYEAVLDLARVGGRKNVSDAFLVLICTVFA